MGTVALNVRNQTLGGVKVKRYQPCGGVRELFRCKLPEVQIEGPAGTGKSLGALELNHLRAMKYDQARILLLRKTRVSIRQSLQVTWDTQVMPQLNGVTFHKDDSEYRYRNGSVVALSGLDRGSKLMSSQWDIVYVQEATELTEDDVQDITTRLRNGKMPYQQLIFDVNPDKEKHFLNVRASAGGPTHRILSRHTDNPSLWDQVNQCWTEKGAMYMARLDTLRGVRRLRLRDGIWASAQGMVYEDFDPAIHTQEASSYINPNWPLYWSIDFGYTNPFVAQMWVLTPENGLLLVKEIYMSHKLVEDHARQIRQIMRYFQEPRAFICDHDAEGRATLEKHLGIKTVPAYKKIRAGIQAVQARMRVTIGKDGKATTGLKLVNGALVQVDTDIQNPEFGKTLPISTRDEIEGYIWDTSNNKKAGEEPVDRDNHGMDCMRYMVCYVDHVGQEEEPPDILAMAQVDGGWVQ